MKITGAMHTAISGLQRGRQRMREAAGRLADPQQMSAASPASPAPALLELKAGERQALLAIRVLQTEDELLGRLVDEKA